MPFNAIFNYTKKADHLKSASSHSFLRFSYFLVQLLNGCLVRNEL